MAQDKVSLSDYLRRYSNCNKIVLVGPMNFNHEMFTAKAHAGFVDPVIFIDGGTKWRHSPLTHTETTGHSLGDGDSYCGSLDTQLDPVKDFSDLSYALSHIGENFGRLQLHGFLGGRSDHELFNLGEVHHFVNSRHRPVVVNFDDRIFALSSGQWRLNLTGTFSIGAIERVTITLSGACAYPCPENTQLEPLSSLGLSNIGSGAIDLKCHGPVLLFTENLDMPPIVHP